MRRRTSRRRAPARGPLCRHPPAPAAPPATTPTTTPFAVGGVVELTADRQEYDEQQKVVTAVGNVVLRFREALLNADRVEVNLPNRVLVAEGNVALTRGQQVLRGDKFQYLFSAPDTDNEGNPTILRWSRKNAEQYIGSEKDGKATKFALVYRKGKWVEE